MLPLSAVQLKITTYDSSDAIPNYFGYTLENTPFYITPIFNNGIKKDLIDSRTYWDVGDGTYYVGFSARHVYKYPGFYNIKATVYTKEGEVYTFNTTTQNTTAQVTVVNALPDTIVFDNLLPAGSLGIYTLPAGKTSDPLKIYRFNSWQNDPYLLKNNYSIMLYASGSKSTFMSVSSYYTNKWSHLKTYFGFVEKLKTSEGVDTYKIIDSTKTTSVSVYAERLPNSDELRFYSYPKGNTSFAGTTGTTLDYNISFVDQKPSKGNDTVIFLYANFDTRGFLELNPTNLGANFLIERIPYGYINYPAQVSYLKSSFNPANTLEITSNGISVEGSSQTIGPLSAQRLHSFSIYPVKWCNSDIPFVVTFKDSQNYTTKCYPPITGARFDGKDPTEINTISIGLYKIAGQDPTSAFTSSSAYLVESATFSPNKDVPLYENSGSYYAGKFNISTEAQVVTLCAAALVRDIPLINQGIAYGFAGQPGFKKVRRFQKEPIYSNCNSEVTKFSLTGNYETYNTSTSSTVAISIAPLKTYKQGSIDRIWIADSDDDRVFIYTLSGSLMDVIKLSAAPTFTSDFTAPSLNDYTGPLNSASPSNIAIDKQGRGWVSLYDALSVVRYNPELGVIDAVVAPHFNNFDVSYIAPNQYRTKKEELSGFVGENLVLPTCIDTDLDNNIVVGYSHPVSSFLIKFDSSNNIKLFKQLPQLYSIQELLVDKNNNIIAFAKNLTDNSTNPFSVRDVLYKWDSSGNLLSGYPMYFNYIGNLTIDLEQNIWVQHDFCKLSRVSPNNDIKEFFIGGAAYDSKYYQGIDGIGVDTDGYLWILHNYDGKIYFYPIVNATQIPLSGLFYANLPDIQLTAPDGQQAFYTVFGDWTGIRWLNKYATSVDPAPRIIRGSSNLFSISKINPILNKINENFDATSALKSYILQESLFDKKILINDFIGQIVGSVESPPESLGKTVYERIANFPSNTSDPEVCNVDALKSLTTSRGLQFYDFTTGYPSKLKRTIDLLSINHSKLLGSPRLKTNNFTLTAYDYSVDTNIGDFIPIDTGKFTVGEPIIAYETFSEKYRIIYNTLIPTTDSIEPVIGQPYPLSGVNYNWGWGLVTNNNNQSGMDIKPYYMFYSFRPNKTTKLVDGVVDYENSLTTISPTNSSYENWIKYAGVMDQVISRALYEGLELIK